ncbi:furin-like protease kpc-1 isoform X5 [Dreissena polymorpha]|uniref:furin-like protease kpc-1 isoform X5 n=1 Tax=Dreissena polymorpha TaxID=45954 RepID=UPI0022641000|nr:furin-like protease kpc-1 isoform X5 [Dreissena polymorpha]
MPLTCTLVFLLATVHGQISDYTDKLFFKVNDKDFEHVAGVLRKEDYTFVSQIISGIYVFQKRGLTGKLSEEDLQLIKSYDDKIQTVEQVRRWQIQPTSNGLTGGNHGDPGSKYGMGIGDAWNLGVTGENVTLGVLDVGVDIAHPYLKDNIALQLSWNYDSNNSDVSPGYQHSYKEMLQSQDHGTNICGLLSANSNENATCAKGVAFQAKLAIMKVAHLDVKIGVFADDDNIARGLAHIANTISIYVNAFTYNNTFRNLDFATAAVLEQGTRSGREGKGSLFVFPSAKIGGGLENNLHTIVVSGVDSNGSVPASVDSNAAVLTSALAHGFSLMTRGMTTTTGTNPETKCTEKFGGTSASTAFLSGILALVLQANPDISWRDVMHIIVQSSEHESLMSESSNFTPNAAGKYFHAMFGFGLINAGKAVTLARTWTPVGNMFAVTGTHQSQRSCSDVSCSVGFDIKCADNCSCVSTVEQVQVSITCHTSNPNKTSVYMTSPSGTKSILVQEGQISTKDIITDVLMRSVNFWGENATGLWIINISITDGTIFNANVSSIIISGTNAIKSGEMPCESQHKSNSNAKSPTPQEKSALGATIAVLFPVCIFIVSGILLYLNTDHAPIIPQNNIMTLKKIKKRSVLYGK